MELPDGWVETTINDLIPNTGLFVDGDWIESKDQNPTGEVRLIQLADIGDGFFKNKSNRHLTLRRALELNCTFLREGDVLVARMPDPIGRACIFPLKGENKFVTAVDVAIIRLGKKSIDPLFLSHSLNNRRIRNQIENLQSGTTRKRISRANLATILIPLPPLPEQHRIVAKIEALFTSLDRGIASLKTAQQQLKIYRQAVLKWAFEGKLTNEGECKWMKLEDFIESLKNGHSIKPEDEGENRILRISSVRPNKLNLDDYRLMKKELVSTESIKENDLLFTRYNGSVDFVGICARVPQLKHQYFYPDKLIRCRLKHQDYFLSKYLELAINHGNSRKFVLSKIKTTAGQTGIAGSEIKQIPVPYPKNGDYINIVAAIESRLSVCDKLEETILQSLQQAEALRQSILKKAFAGQLVPQDPNDEPASVLLERIRAERLKATTSKIVKNKKSEK